MKPTARLNGTRILLGITGGIAAYKTPALVRALRASGAEVQVVMSAGAKHFVTTTSLQAVAGTTVRDSLWDASAEAAMGHIELARWADALLVAPATANALAQFATGTAGDLLSTLYLATTAPVFVAPAMNHQMWLHPATQRNVNTLNQDGVTFFGPGEGAQACGEFGPGRMWEPDELTSALEQALGAGAEPKVRVEVSSEALPNTATPNKAAPNKDALAGRHVVITAGPTREAIDPVRYISNHSSGKQGYALAQAAVEAGARVTLVSGPVKISPPPGVNLVPVTSARDMLAAVTAELPTTDIFIGVAAVADYRPATAADQKIKKSEQGDNGMNLDLVENPDIIKQVAASNPRPFVVGFAAETHDTLEFARAKRLRKGLDMIIVNDVSDQTIGFGSDENSVTLITEHLEETLARQPKSTLAVTLIRHITAQFVDGLAPDNPKPAVS